MKKGLALIAILIIVLIVYPNFNLSSKMVEFDSDKIFVTINEPLLFGDGFQYTVIVKNQNEGIIKHLDVAIGFESGEGNSSTNTLWVDAKPIEAVINIEPNEDVIYTFHLPFSIVKKEEVVLEKVMARYTGYYDALAEKNRFEHWGPIEVTETE